MTASKLTYSLTARASDECTRIELLDGNLRPVNISQGLGEINVELPAGVYAVRFHQGREFTEKLVMLSPTNPHVSVGLTESEMPAFATAAPVAQTTTTHEWQSGPARGLSLSPPMPPPPGQKGGSHLLLFLRNPFAKQGASGVSLPSEVSLHDYQGNQLFHLANGVQNQMEHWAGAHLNLDPGGYRLRRSLLGRRPVEQLIFTSPGWQTQVFLLSAQTEDEPSYIARCSVLMARAGIGFDFNRPDLRWTESALRALHNKSNIPGVLRTEMLWRKFDNPMLGIYAGLLHLRREKIDPYLMKEVFVNLHQLIGPLPDVLAIGLALVRNEPSMRDSADVKKRLQAPDAYATPPMLREAWDQILKASADAPDLIPEDTLADCLGGRIVPNGPWLAWRADISTPLQLPGAASLPSSPPAAATATSLAPVDSSSTGKSLQLPCAPVSLLALSPAPSAPQKPEKTEPADSPRLPWDKLSGILGGVFDQAATVTLQSGIRHLSSLLANTPDAREALDTPYFNAMERRLACWLQPAVDPRLPAEVLNDSFLQEEWARVAETRAETPALLLTDMGLSSTMAVKIAWGVFTKLFIKPVIPRQVQLTTFLNTLEKERGGSRARLLATKEKPSPLRHIKSGRTLNQLECAYLLQWGSPADGVQKDAVDLPKLANRLGEAGFVLAPDSRSVTVSDLQKLQTEFSLSHTEESGVPA
jgi:hypothetical protein